MEWNVKQTLNNWLNTGVVVKDPTRTITDINTIPNDTPIANGGVTANDGSYIWDMGSAGQAFSNPFTGGGRVSGNLLTQRLNELMCATFPKYDMHKITGPDYQEIAADYVEIEKATLTLEKVKHKVLRAAHGSNVSGNCSLDDIYGSITISEYERAHSFVGRFRHIDNANITSEGNKELLLDKEGVIAVLSAIDEMEGVDKYLSAQDPTNFQIGLSLLASMAVDESK